MDVSGSDTLRIGRLAPRPGVYFAVVDGEGVAMDIMANRYYGLTGEAAQVWRSIVGAGVSPADPTQRAAGHPEARISKRWTRGAPQI